MHPVTTTASIGVRAGRRDAARAGVCDFEQRSACGSSRGVDADDELVAYGGTTHEDGATLALEIGVQDTVAAERQLDDPRPERDADAWSACSTMVTMA